LACVSRRIPFRWHNLFQISIHHVTPSLENISKAILDRINIDDLRPINDPVTTGQDASALGLGRVQELIPFKRAL